MKLQNQDFLYVTIQFILFGLFLFNFKLIDFQIPIFLKNISLIIAIIGGVILSIALLQLNKNLSPFPTPISGGTLMEGGLYKYIRHPIYTGILVTLWGYGLYTSSVYKLVIVVLLLFLFFYKSKYEETKLSQVFKAYPDYMNRTGRFFSKVF